MKTPAAGLSPQQLRETVFGFAPVIMLDAAVRLGIFDTLSAGPLTSADVPHDCQIAHRGARPLLDALASLKFLRKEDGRYSLTPESAAFLVKTSPTFVGGFVQHNVHNMLPAWQQLETVVRSGKPARNLDSEQQGAAFFREFVPALFTMSHGAAGALAEEILRERGRGPMKVLDVGAGSGVFGIALAAANPSAIVTLADWKDVLNVAREIALKQDVFDRVSFAEGDLFESDFGSGFDVAMLANILHMESAERCQMLLRKVCNTLGPGGTLAIVEYVPDDDRTFSPINRAFDGDGLPRQDSRTTCARSSAGFPSR